MAERRQLVEGVKGVDVPRAVEEQFVFGEKATPPTPADPPLVSGTTPPPQAAAGRLPLTTRVRADLAVALKRASLERELAGAQPHTVQDILEAALEPWLRVHGHLS